MIGTCTSAVNRAELGSRPSSATAEAMERPVRSEHAVSGVNQDGQDEGEQRRAAVQPISDPGQRDGGVLEARSEGCSWDDVSIWARCSVQCAR